MSNLVIQAPSTDFVVNPNTGEAFISTSKAAELLGVARYAIQKHIAVGIPNYVITNGLTPEILQEVAVHYAYVSKAANPIAKAFLAKLLEAGAKAFIYHSAGVKIHAVTNVPLTYKEGLQMLLDNEIERERLQEVILNQTVVIEEKKVITDDSPHYYTVNRIRKLNPNITFSGSKLTELSEEMGIAVGKIYDTYGLGVNCYHHTVWEELYPDANYPE